ncbi:class I SAM-dependent methyltransferase [Nafulsella turpanensis]|uniref:class I SAM-dependent methyltransferase n=1 Tax=Nafulsella turpanensis TaxID=1265690 RepID=UPI00058F8274|nr:methyltransferase domain-containing protein [Nafulsella turpanensis]
MAQDNMYETGEYLKKNQDWHVSDSPWKAGNIYKIIQRNNLKYSSVCEVGCGAGEILKQLSYKMPQDVKFEGYEISPQAYELSKSRENDRIKFHLKDLLEEDPKVKFDIVMAIDVFEHVEDSFSFLRKLRSRGKYKVFHIPLDITINGILQDKFMTGRNTVGHINYYTKETALATLEDTGYEIMDYFYTADSLELPRKTFKSKLAKLPRKLLFGANEDFAVKLMGGFSLMVLAR